MQDDRVLSTDEFVALYPWPEGTAEGKRLEYLWHFDYDVSPPLLWPYVAETSRMNRALGMPEMHIEEHGGLNYGRIKYGMFRHEWMEEPWEWVAGSYWQSIRHYEHGLAKIGRGIFYLSKLGQGRGTRLYAYYGWVPRSLWARWCLQLGMRSMGRRVGRVLDSIVADIAEAHRIDVEQAEKDELSLPMPATLMAASASATKGEDVEPHLSGIREALLANGLASDVVDRLIRHVLEGDEMDLVRIQVRALARTWGVDEDALVRTCLHATRCGLLRLSWDVICPHCRGVRVEARHLGDVPSLGHCEVCDIDFANDKSNAIEITFHVHPSIRDVPRRFFCSAEPALQGHVRMRCHLKPKEERDVALSLAPGRYRMRLHGQTVYRFWDIVYTDTSTNSTVVHKDGPAGVDDAKRLCWQASASGEFVGDPGAGLTLVNDTDFQQVFILERAMWADVALRPSRLFSMQEFRDLFSEEYLATDVQLAVGEQTILFTDIVGSTRFYARCGDPEAFAAVKRHFQVIYDIVGRCGGAVIKTIGDAAMGAFESPLRAIKAAREIQLYFLSEDKDVPVQLRVSLHVGPCIAVNLNSGIDYFGSTVNLAAKIQACAGAGDIAMSSTIASAPGVMAFARSEDANIETIRFPMQALGTDIDVLLWQGPRHLSATEGASETGLEVHAG